MTDTKLLALARAVYPQHDVHTYTGVTDQVYWKWRAKPEDGHYTVWNFDPANNSDQFVAVLAWLLRNIATIVTHRNVEVWHSNDILVCDIEHDGTPSGLRAAVTEAGMRVVG